MIQANTPINKLSVPLLLDIDYLKVSKIGQLFGVAVLSLTITHTI